MQRNNSISSISSSLIYLKLLLSLPSTLPSSYCTSIHCENTMAFSSGCFSVSSKRSRRRASTLVPQRPRNCCLVSDDAVVVMVVVVVVVESIVVVAMCLFSVTSLSSRWSAIVGWLWLLLIVLVVRSWWWASLLLLSLMGLKMYNQRWMNNNEDTQSLLNCHIDSDDAYWKINRLISSPIMISTNHELLHLSIYLSTYLWYSFINRLGLCSSRDSTTVGEVLS